MSRNGSGTYTLPAGNPVVTNTVISSTWANTTLIDLANAMTGSVAADGQTPMTGPLNLNSNKIANVTDPTSDQDAATKYYVDNFIQDSANVTYNEGATGATTRTVKSKLQESVSVLDFGADPTGVADSTTAIQNAVNTAHRVFFPEGTYKTGSIAIPSNTALIGETVGGVIITANGTITESGLFETTSTTKVEIANFTFSAMFSSYATLSAIFVNSSSFCHVHDVYINAANYGVNFVNATDSIIERVTVINANQIGITVSGASNARNKVLTCTVNTTTVSHAIQINQGSYCEVSNCYCSNAKIFGISLFITEFTIATNNTTVNTEREGINLEGANTCTVSNNDLTWSNTSTSLDFGLSLFGNPTAEFNNFNIVTNNFIAGCAKSGIALAEQCSQNTISNNIVINPNSLNETQGAGILIYGSGGGGNLITGNNTYANNSKMYYGINDATSGVSGSSNTINNNTITGFTTSAVKKDVATTQALNTIGFLSYTPVVTAETGTITSYTSTGNYYEIGKMVFFTIGIVITNAGTGSNAVLATLPFTNTSINCTAIGKENSISGNTLEGLIASNATTIKIVNYNSSSTLSTGATITVTGFYQRV